MEEVTVTRGSDPTIPDDGIRHADDHPIGLIGISEKFALANRFITRDIYYSARRHRRLFRDRFFTKEKIQIWLHDPARFEPELREACRYIYGASPHFRRLIQYFVGLTDLAYIVEPYKIDPETANRRTTNLNYRKVLNLLSSMNLRTQIPKILTVCLREDVFYGTLIVSPDCVTIHQLPSEWCAISTVEGNVPNVTFDFSYFDNRIGMLECYPEEFRIKYERYRTAGWDGRWIELDAPNSFAVKCNSDILDFAIPPFAGVLGDIFDIDKYKGLKLDKTELENYAMLFMKIPLTDEGEWGIDLDKARDFFNNMDSVLPDEIGAVLTPMDISKISFERTNADDADTVTKAEQNLFTAAGVSSLLFNNEKASANALLLSIKADQAITFGIVKLVEDAINRYIQAQFYGKRFRINFLDSSPFNRKELGDGYLKAASYGLPTISMYAATQGLGQAELDSMSFLEGEVMRLQDIFKPIQSSSQMSSSDLESKAATDEGGAPQKDAGELTDSGEQTREDGDDW